MLTSAVQCRVQLLGGTVQCRSAVTPGWVWHVTNSSAHVCLVVFSQVVPNSSGLPIDDIIAVLLLIWFGVQTLRRCGWFAVAGGLGAYSHCCAWVGCAQAWLAALAGSCAALLSAAAC